MGYDVGEWTAIDSYADAPPKQQRGSYYQPIDLDADDEPIVADRPSKKRKRRVEPEEGDAYNIPAKSAKSTSQEKGKPKAKKDPKQPEEKRLRRFRKHAPTSFNEICGRALTQRFCILDRQRVGTEAEPAEVLQIAGTTGNIYTIRIDKVPSCDCPHAVKGNQCKHIVYVMMRTLKAHPDLAYQLALTSSELLEIFAAAPPLPSEVAPDGTSSDRNRKPLDDDCPICYDQFDEHEKSVWCQDGCGNNIHSGCFEKWATTKRAQDGKVTCPMCRTLWRETDVRVGNLKSSGTVNAEGYRNVGAELGLSGRRDYSSYHSYWVQRQRRQGLVDDEY